MKNGTLNQENEPQHDCPECQDSGLVKVGDNLYAQCKCIKKKRISRLFEKSGLTAELKKKTFENFSPRDDQKEMLEKAKEYAEHFEDIKDSKCNGMAFVGNPGNGKTHLMAAIANYLLEKGIVVLFVNTPELIAELRIAQFDKDVTTGEEKLKLISEAELVIFDDLSKEKPTEWVQTQYYRIINQRYINHLPTLFCSNSSYKELIERLGEATASRLAEMVKERIIKCEGPDYRLQK